jgi:hypothetical protein
VLDLKPDLQKEWELPCKRGKGALQAEGTGCAKAPSQEGAGSF